MEKRILIRELIGVARCSEPLRVGVPFAKGELDEVAKLALLNSAGTSIPLQAETIARWQDGSVKWALFDFFATVPASVNTYYTIVHGENSFADSSVIQITSGEDVWCIDTGEAQFLVDAREYRPFVKVSTGGRDVLSPTGGRCLLRREDESTLPAFVERIEIETPGPLHAILRISGSFNKEISAPRFASRLHFYAGKSLVSLEFTIHNPCAATHPGGLWDLGDSGAFLFKELAFEFNFTDEFVKNLFLSPEQGKEPVCASDPTESLLVYQESSGGKHWQSPNHRNRNGDIPFSLCGYEVRNGDKQFFTGLRAAPILWCGSEERGLSAVLPHFWQEFPKAMEANFNFLKVSLFPGCFPDRHELQGGEQKTHSLYLDFNANSDCLEWARSPLGATSSPADIRQANVIFDLPSSPRSEPGKVDLIDQFISGPDEFIRKRESVDEYGWRNFGDIYADHEGVSHKSPELFISHYNNQYDICAGMYRKFMATGDQLWGEIAADLARHVLDIDIYHTSEDREEYNNGLFWHTDHYIQAGLSTHRSFSREQIGNRDPRFCGGGPGAEHCYTSGLMLHYFMNGDSAFRVAVVKLAEWCYLSLSGSRTVLGTTNRALRYFSLLRNSDKSRKQLFPRYPLSRGTGNAINACLDAYEVSGDRKYLERAEELIRGAIHPDDNLEMRDLLNAEDSWSYTVLLLSLVKYLIKQEEREDFGSGYIYAKTCLMVYAGWMYRHEYPYLDKPEILEYPNETWVAQEPRKSVLFYSAARYADGELREAFLNRSRFFYNYCSEELARHSSRGFTRPLALLFQNGWIGAKLDEDIALMPVHPGHGPISGGPVPMLTTLSVGARICREFKSALRDFSLKRESAWLMSRLKSRKA